MSTAPAPAVTTPSPETGRNAVPKAPRKDNTETRIARMGHSMLWVDNITVSFDGFKAINNLNLVLMPGELRCIIGPNGAGKTTMMDIITGKTRPDSGYVYMDGARIELTSMTEPQIARLGIGRKFQRPTVFEQLTTFENLELACKGPRNVFRVLGATLTSEQRDRIDEVLKTIGLGELRELRSGLLSHGQKQWLEIGMLLVQDPKVMLIDEPVAGMTPVEIERTTELLLSLAGARTVVVVEHDMEFVRKLAVSRTVTVLHEGSILAEGAMDEVQNNPEVIRVYLGGN
jgi:urea transport system ATP-binding protein